MMYSEHTFKLLPLSDVPRNTSQRFPGDEGEE